MLIILTLIISDPDENPNMIITGYANKTVNSIIRKWFLLACK